MNTFSIRDLELAGVKWEINEIPNKPKLNQIIDKHEPIKESARVIPNIPASKPIGINDANINIDSITDIQQLLTAISEFNHPLKSFVKNVILPKCAEKPGGLLIITDIPSAADDETGGLMTGGAGELLDKMLTAIELDKNCVSICPLLFWATPGGRVATREELDLTRPFIDKAVSLLNPSAILTLGTTTALQIANAKLPADHGNVIDLNSVPVIPIYHPNYLLLKPGAKKDVWAALQNLQKILKNQNK